MKERIIRKILYIVITSSAILLLIAIGFHVRLNDELQLQKTYVAAKDILPREKIEENDLIEIEVAKAYLQDYTYTTKEEIIGKYTEIQGMIPAGSPFYKSMLFDESDLPDNPFTQLKSGQAAYSMNVDLSSLGGVLKSGQRVDIHYSIVTNDLSLTDCLIENVRIISIKDHRGIDVESDESSKTPYLAILAVNEEDVSLLTLADSIGQVKLITSSSTYDSELEASRVQDSKILAYLDQKQNSIING